MRTLSLALLLSLAALDLACRNAHTHAGPPQTAADLDAALQRAAAGGRLLLVVPDGGPQWQQFHRTTLRDPAVAAWIDRHAAIFTLDLRRGRELRRRLGLSERELLLYRAGQEFERSVGQRDPTTLLLWLKDAREGRVGLGRLAQLIVYGGRERDLELRLDYVDALTHARAYDEAARELAWIFDHYHEVDETARPPHDMLLDRMKKIMAAHPPTVDILVEDRGRRTRERPPQ